MTQYVILRKDNPNGDLGPDGWYEAGQAEASSVTGALRKLGLPEGVYVAVPARSWKPLPVKVDTKTVVTIG